MPTRAAAATVSPALRWALDLAAASPAPMAVLAEGRVTPNAAFAALAGLPAGTALDAATAGLDGRACAEALAGRSVRRPFRERLAAAYGPVPDPAGGTAGVLVVLERDATSSAEEQLGLEIAGVVGAFVATFDPDRVKADARFASLLGVEPAAAAEGRPSTAFLAGIDPADRPAVAAGLKAALRTGTPLRVEFRVAGQDGPPRWLQVRARAEREGERTVRLVGAAIDVTDQRRAESALRESEARFRHMADSAPALIWMTDETGEIVFANMHYDHLFGRPARDMLGTGWHDVILPDDLPRFEGAFSEAFRDRRPFRAEVRVRDRHGALRWLRCEGVPRLDDAHRFLGYTGCNVDVTEAKVAEERRDLLINELNHRVKNTLATVQSIATQTLRNVSTSDQARRDIEARLMALSRAHDVLTRENWEGASLREIAAQALAPYRGAGDGRLLVAGPDVRLSPRTALAFAMAFQELATNAVKYGALANDAGIVRVAWRLRAGADGRRGLSLRWEESGGPPVRIPERRGFGSRLIEQGLARDLDGAVRIAFEPGGVVCTIEAPLTD